jgi:hypothetical protein
MKLLYAIDITEDKKNQEENIYKEFIVEQTDEIQKEHLQKAAEVIQTQEKEIALPKWMSIGKTITLIIWFILGAGIVNAISDDTTIQEGFDNAPAIFIIFPIAFLSWLFIYVYERRKKTQANDNSTYLKRQEDALNIAEGIYESLGVPKDAIQMDVLSFRYIIKEGQIKRRGTSVANFINVSKRVFIEDDTLNIVDTDKRIGIPLNAIQHVEKAKRRGMVIYWNKDVPYNKGKYKPYKIKVNGMGVLIMDYGIMNISYENEDYQLYLPLYEIDQLKEMIDIEVIEAK